MNEVFIVSGDEVREIAAARIKELEAFLQLSPWDGFTKFAQQLARDTLIIHTNALLSGAIVARHTEQSIRAMTTETLSISVFAKNNNTGRDRYEQ